MKLIIAGGRDYRLTQADHDRLDEIEGVTEVVSGGATGADDQGELWAIERDIPVRRFPADWEAFGKGAGPRRNAEMAAYADAVVLFPGGKGTESMFRESRRAGLVIHDWRSAESPRPDAPRPKGRRR